MPLSHPQFVSAIAADQFAMTNLCPTIEICGSANLAGLISVMLAFLNLDFATCFATHFLAPFVLLSTYTLMPIG
jgi:hypothetical protein